MRIRASKKLHAYNIQNWVRLQCSDAAFIFYSSNLSSEVYNSPVTGKEIRDFLHRLSKVIRTGTRTFLFKVEQQKEAFSKRVLCQCTIMQEQEVSALATRFV